MATQSIPTHEQMNNAAVLPVLRRRETLRRTSVPATVRPAAVRPATRKAVQMAEDRQRLLIEMLPQVKRIAFKVREHLPSHVELDDLIANGIMGLVDAISKFDTAKRVKLESYARYRIRGSILDGLRSVDPASRDLRRKNKKIQKVYRELKAKLGRPVLDEEIADALEMTLAQWHSALSEIQTVSSDFGARLTSAGPTAKRPSVDPALLTGEDADPFELCYRREQREILGRALSHLRERERELINLYYHQDLTMKQIAGRMHIDESRVSQVHAAALVRLKAVMRSLLRPHAGLAAAAPLSMAAGAGL
jgi:RNA polymerase sigma factor FliA